MGISAGAGFAGSVTDHLQRAGLGAMMGSALSDDHEKGALAGAIGAVTAETVADIVQEDSDVVAGRVLERARAERKPLTQESSSFLQVHDNSMRNGISYKQIK